MADSRLIKEYLIPYLRDLYKDLTMRSIAPGAVKDHKLDRVAFVQYCNLPGIVSERLLKIFDTAGDGIITEGSFVQNFTRIFVSDLESRMQLAFSM